MKKFWTIFTIALVAMACSDNKIDDENTIPTPSVDELCFFASAEDLTRTYLEADGEIYHTKWVGNESLTVVSESNSFKFANSFAAPNKFTCSAEGVSELVGKSVEIVYTKSGEADGDIESGAGAAGIKLSTVVTLENEGEYKLDVACAFLLYSSSVEVTFTAQSELFCEGGELKSSMTLPAGNSVFVPIVAASAEAAECELSYTLGSSEAVSVTINPSYNTINDLGVLTPTESENPEDPTPGEPTSTTIYLVPNEGWMADGAWFAAYFWNEATTATIKLTDENSDGIYECEAPADMTGMLFCRMNPAYTEFAWNSETETDHVWNQTTDTVVGTAPANYFYITTWDAGEWHEAGYVVPDTPVTPSGSDFALAGSFSEWGDVAMENNNGIYSAKGVAMEAYAELKIKDAASWDLSFGAATVAYMNPGNHIVVAEGGNNISITEAGTYDVYFDHANLLLYVVAAGADYTTAPLQTENGKEPEVVEPEVTDNVVYLKPNSNWMADNARFAAYFWNDGGNSWVSATDKDGDGVYEIYIPTGYGTNIIFCRMNPSTTANNWTNKWDQTIDLTIPTDGKNLFTVNEGEWNNANGVWSTK